MRILYVSPYLPYPAHSGGRTRLLHLVDSMARKHHIVIAGLQKPDERVDWGWYEKRGIELTLHPRHQPFAIKNILNAFRVGSIYVGTHLSDELKHSVESLLSNGSFDLVHVICSYIINNLPKVLNIPLIVEEPNLQHVVLRQYSRVVAEPALRWLYMREADRLESLAVQAANSANTYICSSPADEAIMRESFCTYNIRVVCNGVDADFYSYKFSPKSSRPTLVFLANFNYFPNVDAMLLFVKDIFPEIRSRVPDVRLLIVGYHADTTLSYLRDGTTIEVRGYKPDIRTELSQAWISICPLRSGSGSRIKILESMAVGTPVVSTPIGCMGLPLENGKNIVVATNDNLAASIIELLCNADSREKIALSARSLVETQLTWKQSAISLEEIYAQVVYQSKKKTVRHLLTNVRSYPLNSQPHVSSGMNVPRDSQTYSTY